MKICCFGSLNLDLVFSVREFVQPKETIQSKGFSVFAGGKGLNQAMAIRKAGAPVLMAGSIGRDGQMLLETCDEHGLDRSQVRVTEINTGMAVIQVNDSGENCIILYDGANKANDIVFIDQVLAQLAPGDFLVLQNEVNNLVHLIAQAHRQGIRVILNPSPFEAGLKRLPLHYCDWLILNEVEGKALSGKDIPQEILNQLRLDYPNTAIILTYGSEGVYYAQGETSGQQSAFQVQAVDTTGAGDAFTGYFIAMTAKGLPITEAITIAQKAASISVTRKGAAASIPVLAEVASAMAGDQP